MPRMSFLEKIVILTIVFTINSAITSALSGAVPDRPEKERQVYATSFPRGLTESARRSPAPTMTLIKHEGFEDAWPNDWGVFTNSGYADCYWGDVNCVSYTGGWSGWCADNGYDAPPTVCSNYVDNMSGWMIYGPFNLVDATGGYFEFEYILDSEVPYDTLYYGVSLDGSNFNGYTIDQYSPGWTYVNLDFTNVPGLGNVCGYYQVWIALKFASDYSNSTGEGAYLDEINIWKDVVGGYVEFGMNSHFYYPDDWCVAFVNYSYPSQIYDVPLFVILEVYSQFYFAPSFSYFDHYWVSPGPSPNGFDIFYGFYWPYGVGYADGLRWYAAMTDYYVEYLISNVSTFDFGYSDY